MAKIFRKLPARPQPAVIKQPSFEQEFEDEPNLLNGDTYDHLLFDLHALNTYTHQVTGKTLPLLPKQQSWFVRHARYTFLNVYRRLFTVVFALNFLLALPIVTCK